MDPATLALIGMGLGFFGSMFGGMSQESTSRSINAANIAMQRETNQMQREMFNQNLNFQHNERELQNAFNAAQAMKFFNLNNEWNSESARVQRFLQAGLNPMSVAGVNGSVSAQSAPSGQNVPGSAVPVMTAPHAQMYEVAEQRLIENMQGTANTIASLARASKDSADSNMITKTTEAKFNELMASAAKLQEDARGQFIANNLLEQFGVQDRQSTIALRIAEFGNLMALREKAISEGNYYQAQEYLTDMKSIGQNIRNGMDRKQAAMWQEFLDIDLKKGYREIEELRARAFQEWSQGEENKALKTYYNTLQKGQQIENDLKLNEKAFQDQTFQDRVHRYFYDTDAHFYGSQEQKAALDDARANAEMAMKENNYWKFTYWLNQVNRIANTSLNIFGAIATRGFSLAARNRDTWTFEEDGINEFGFPTKKTKVAHGRYVNGRFVSQGNE